MNLDEKTCQLATLYGYQRVLTDALPTPQWKQKIWKDGIANIDEQLSGFVGGRGIGVPSGVTKDETNVWPASSHAKAINQIQKWFIEETRLGVPVDFSAEGIRGLGHLRATCFSNQNGMGSTFDRALIRRQGEIVGSEGRGARLHQHLRADPRHHARPALGPQRRLLRGITLPRRGAGRAADRRHPVAGRGGVRQALHDLQRQQGRP
jgi:hypothetical protein